MWGVYSLMWDTVYIDMCVCVYVCIFVCMYQGRFLRGGKAGSVSFSSKLDDKIIYFTKIKQRKYD